MTANKKSQWCLILIFATGVCFASSAELTKEKAEAILAKKAAMSFGRFPIGFWNYTNLDEHLDRQQQADVQQWAEAGFTAPISPGFDSLNPSHVTHIKQMLDWCQRANMKLRLSDKNAYGPGREGETIAKVPADYRQKFRKSYNEFKGHKALFGFVVGDEPTKSNGPGYFEVYKTQVEVAPELTPFMNLLPYWPTAEMEVGFETWSKYLDAVAKNSDLKLYSYDCYTQMGAWRGWEGYFENLRLFREASIRNEVPFWTSLLSVGHFGYKCPDYEDLKLQFSTAICAGASGIDWFFYYMREPHGNYRFSPVDEFWETTQTYDDLRKIHKAFHKRYGDLFNKLVSSRVIFYPKARGGFDAFSSDSSDTVVADVKIAQCQSEDKSTATVMLGEFVDKDGNNYLMIVNDSYQSTRPEIKIKCENANTYMWNWQGQKVFSGRGDKDGYKMFGDWLAPGQELLICIEKDKK